MTGLRRRWVGRGSSLGLTELQRPAPLDTGRHVREDFDCGVPSFNEWLRRYAGQNRRGNTAATWVIADNNDRVVGYVCLAMDAIDISKAPPALAKNSPKHVPVMLIGRLAVDSAFTDLGIGTSLVAYALGTAADINEKAACKAVRVVALNAFIRSWWEQFDFKAFTPEDPECLDLYLLVSDIAATFAAYGS